MSNNNISNTRWTREEELSLIKDIANGYNLNLIAEKHGRSVSAIELRLKRIIYENIKSGTNLQNVSKLLKINIDKVTQYYYSYKEFKEKHSNHASPVEQQGGNSFENNNSNNNNIVSRIQIDEINKQYNDINKELNVNEIEKINLEKAFAEPSGPQKLDSKLKKIETENKILNLIIENKKLTEQLNKLIKEGKVDPSIKTLIKVLRKSS